MLLFDTNVYCHFYELLPAIFEEAKTFRNFTPVLSVPYIINSELDTRKSNRQATHNVQRAVYFIRDKLKDHHPRIRGQTLDEIPRQSSSYRRNNDDIIIEYCLILMQKFERVLLVSHDGNIQAKALLLNIEVMDPVELAGELNVELSPRDARNLDFDGCHKEWKDMLEYKEITNILSRIKVKYPEKYSLIEENRGYFGRSLVESVTSKQIETDNEAIQNLEAMGFPRDIITPLYFACSRNEKLTLDILLEEY